jgi:hypothetical protein
MVKKNKQLKISGMKKILFIIIATTVLSGCATRNKIEYRDRDVIKYVSTIQRDTLINNIHDSIYNNIFTKGDTIYNIKYKERIAYKNRLVYKTDTIKRDSIQTQYKENTIIKTKIPKWCFFLLVVNIFFCIFVGVKLYIKWRTKI